MSATQALIIAETHKIIIEKGNTCPALTPRTAFLNDTPMDSLDLATLIVTLEMSLEKDPFRDGFKTFHTIGELSHLYDNC